jgi:phage terminase large subunit-like protein
MIESSLALQMAKLSEREFSEIADVLERMPEEEILDLLYDWSFWGRPDQQEPEGDYTTWISLAGRGSGKTRTGSEWCHKLSVKYPGCRIGIVAPTAADLRDVIVEGDSGLLATAHPKLGLEYFKTDRGLRYKNGTMIKLYSAEEPRRLRGPQHHFMWPDEMAAYQKPDEVWAMLKFGLRLPRKHNWPRDYRPRVLVTTTPLPIPIIKRLVGFGKEAPPKGHRVVSVSTYANRENLAPEFFAEVISEYEGTRLGRQELQGEILADVPGALWRQHMIDPFRVAQEQLPDQFDKIVVSIDPATTAASSSNLTGITVCAAGEAPLGMPDKLLEMLDEKTASGIRKRARRRHGYVLADVSMKGSPDEWARRAIRAMETWGASAIVAETNQGGDMVKHTIRTIDADVKVICVTATKNKQTRAEPIVAQYEQGRVHHLGHLTHLEDELLTWDPDEDRKSPDRLDSMVWGIHHLIGKKKFHGSATPQGVGDTASNFDLFGAEAGRFQLTDDGSISVGIMG